MAAPSPSAASLAGKTLAQLRELARLLGKVSFYSRLSKSSLIKVLSQLLPDGADQAGAADPADRAIPATPVAVVGAGAEPLPLATDTAAAPEVATRVMFLPRDPQWAYVCWQISPGDRERAAAAGGRQLALRVADVTGLAADTPHPHTFQELVVDASGSEWYLPVPLSGRDYRVELGFRLAGSGWLALAQSAVARVPADGPEAMADAAFLPFSLVEPIAAATPGSGGGGVEHERLYQLATVASPRRRRVGSEVLHGQPLTPEAEQAGLLQASGAGLWASGLSESGSGLGRQRSFWLVADAELIVYGATEPSASLFIGDRQVPLETDGTFRVQVPFRDGQQLYPIRALAVDGEQQRSIRLEFERCTPLAQGNSRDAATMAWF